MKLPYNEYIKTPEYRENMIRKKLWDFDNNCPKGGWKTIDESPGKPVDLKQLEVEDKLSEIVAEIFELSQEVESFKLYGPNPNNPILSIMVAMKMILNQLESVDMGVDRMLKMPEQQLWVKSKQKYLKFK